MDFLDPKMDIVVPMPPTCTCYSETFADRLRTLLVSESTILSGFVAYLVCMEISAV